MAVVQYANIHISSRVIVLTKNKQHVIKRRNHFLRECMA